MRDIALTSIRRWSLSVVVVLLAASACGPSEPEPQTPPPPPPPAPTVTAAPTASVAEPPPPPPPAKPTAVVDDVPPSPDPKPLPTVKIQAPRSEASFDAAKARDVEVKLEVKDWALGEGSNHVHLILDEYPYKAIYDAKKPVKLSELLPEGTDLTEGQHVLHAFPSRPTHESVKGKGASAMVTFWVGKKGTPTIDPKKPHLIYSRPKGKNPGPMGQALMIDFYLHGTTLEDGSRVRYTVSGETLAAPASGEFTKWAPKVVRVLPKGQYQVRLELLDKDGKPVGGFLNDVSRTVEVDPTAEMDPKMGEPMVH